MNQEAIDKANKFYDEGSISELYEFIKPFLENDDPYALYFSSRFSLGGWNETDDQFDKRSVEALTKAAEADVVEALYRLSALYFAGDIVKININAGKRCLDRAADLNFWPAKLSVGINLYYGSNGYPKNLVKAVDFVSEATRHNVEGASEILEKIKVQRDLGSE
jgi:TPR repeat protein